MPHLSAARERSENTARYPPRPVVHWPTMGEAGEPSPTPQLMLFASSRMSHAQPTSGLDVGRRKSAVFQLWFSKTTVEKSSIITKQF